MGALAVVLANTTVLFEDFVSTIRLFSSTGLYTFGAAIISDLFVLYPCFEGAQDEDMMVHDPASKCYSRGSLIGMSLAGMCIYGAAISYILGFALWNRKDIIHHPAQHNGDVVRSTYRAYGFL